MASEIIGIRVVDAANRKEVYQEVMKQLDKEENDFLPQVAVDQHYLHFSDVHFYERVSRSFKVTNTGPVIVKFLFKEQPKSKRYCRPWLKADPYNGTLKKGESVGRYFFTAFSWHILSLPFIYGKALVTAGFFHLLH